jgi:hypothetical protein
VTAVPEPIEVPSVEKIVVAYYKSRDEVLAHVGLSRIASRHPSSLTDPWVRVMAMPGRSLSGRPRGAVEARVQVECYGGNTSDAQAEAQALAEACASVHVVIDEDPDFEFDDAVITDGALTTEPWRFPDPDFTPARERYLFDAAVTFFAYAPAGS